MDQEPNLDEPGIPLLARNERGDVVAEIPLTIRQNLADLVTQRGGLDHITDEDLATLGYTRRHLVCFILDLHDEQQDTQEHIASEVAHIEAMTGETVRMPELVKDRYDLLHLKNPPEETPLTGEPEPNAGREPPEGTGWGDDA
jgi:hypothetical protein